MPDVHEKVFAILFVAYFEPTGLSRGTGEMPNISGRNRPDDPAEVRRLLRQAIENATVHSIHPPEVSTNPTTGQRVSIRNISRTLTEEELRQPGVIKMVIEQLERADEECQRLRPITDKCYAAEKEAAILREKLQFNVAFEIIAGVGIAAGSAMISLASIFYPTNQTMGQTWIGVGFFLLLGSFLAKYVEMRRR